MNVDEFYGDNVLAKDVIKSKYLQPTEENVEDMWHRVAKACASVESKNKKEWENKFYNLLNDFKVVPGGRILAGAGIDDKISLTNCYISDIDDCIWEGENAPSIYKTLVNHALTFKSSGGTSANLSCLRPRGTPINNNVNQESCGPVGFMELFSVNTATISAGRNRRGALLLGLRVDHPDILEFINVKSDDDLKVVLSKVPEKDRQECWKLLNNYRSVSNANISILITDEFMKAVLENKEFTLRWAAGDDYVINGVGEEYKTIKAKDLWDIIMKANYDNAEPGVLFYDNIKKNFATQYHLPFLLTNPCISGDIHIMTSEGPKRVGSLLGKQFKSYVNSPSETDKFDKELDSTKEGFFATGYKPIYLLQTKEGHSVKLTLDHPVRVLKGKRCVDIPAEQLQVGDLIVLNDSREHGWEGKGTFEIGWLLGSIIGDGYFHKEQQTAILQYWGDSAKYMVAKAINFISHIDAADSYNKQRTGTEVETQKLFSTSSRSLWNMAEEFGVSHDKGISEDILLTSSEFQKGFLKGIFDADGSVQGNTKSGFSIRLSSSTKNHLEICQKMLLNLGVNSTLYCNRRNAHDKLMPDGKGGQKMYHCKAQHELAIPKENIITYKNKIGFNEPSKISKLKVITENYNRNFKKEKFVARFESLTFVGEDTVYDCCIPEYHHFSANSLILHNCGEIPTSAHGNCNLSSFNISKYVENEKINYDALKSDIRIALRFLDNIIDYNIERHALPEQKREALALRRCGLGFMGLADLFILMKIKYGSEESIQLTGEVSKFFAEECWRASIELAKEKGSFPAFDVNKFMECDFVQKLPIDIKNDIKRYGIRNSAVNSIQPTGSTSIVAQCSSGLEPIFNKGISLRRVRDEHDYEKFNEYKVGHPLLLKLFTDGEVLPEYVVDAYDVDPFSKVRLQAAIQNHFDGNISNTINLPKDFPLHLLSKIFILGWELGLRGMTVYREGSRMGILEKIS